MKTEVEFLQRKHIDYSVLLLCGSNDHYDMSIDENHHHYHHHLQKITVNMDTGAMVVGYKSSPIW